MDGLRIRPKSHQVCDLLHRADFGRSTRDRSGIEATSRPSRRGYRPAAVGGRHGQALRAGGPDGADTIRKWEITGPTGPVAELLRILSMASDRYPILDMFNVFDRHDVPVKERPARRQAFREQMRGDVRRRIG